MPPLPAPVEGHVPVPAASRRPSPALLRLALIGGGPLTLLALLAAGAALAGVGR